VGHDTEVDESDIGEPGWWEEEVLEQGVCILHLDDDRGVDRRILPRVEPRSKYWCRSVLGWFEECGLDAQRRSAEVCNRYRKPPSGDPPVYISQGVMMVDLQLYPVVQAWLCTHLRRSS